MSRVVHGVKWSHIAFQTYAEVMREASDNTVIDEPSQPSAEHSASLRDLCEPLRTKLVMELECQERP